MLHMARRHDKNAHPHLHFHNTFSAVHNGIIENYLEVKKFLEENGYEPSQKQILK